MELELLFLWVFSICLGQWQHIVKDGWLSLQSCALCLRVTGIACLFTGVTSGESGGRESPLWHLAVSRPQEGRSHSIRESLDFRC